MVGHLPLAEAEPIVINTIISPELWAYVSRIKTGDDMRQHLKQGLTLLHGLWVLLHSEQCRSLAPSWEASLRSLPSMIRRAI